MATRRIISMDGGGILALLSTRLLQRIEHARPGFLALTDMFAGTSAGGIDALILGSVPNPVPLQLETCIRLWQESKGFTTDFCRTLGYVAGANALFSPAQMSALLTGMFGDHTLSSLPKRVMVASFELYSRRPGSTSWRPKIFHNFPYPGERDLRERIVDVGLRTSAAPVLLPIQGGFVDGGVFANNPAMCALAQVLDARAKIPAEGGAGDDDLLLFSVGTGDNPQWVRVGNADWGYKKWLLDSDQPLILLDVFLQAPSLTVDFQCRTILKERFWRLNPTLEKAVYYSLAGLTKEDTAELLNEAAFEFDLGPTLEWIDRSKWFGTEPASAPAPPVAA
jgi:hypothetical protein